MATKRTRKAPAEPEAEVEETESDQEESDQPPTSVTLKGSKGSLKTSLVVPRSLGVRNEITYAIAESEIKAFCAALGACSASIQKKVRFGKGTGALSYGADVLEYLLGEGVSYRDVRDAGQVAWYWISRDVIPSRDLQEEEDFFGAPTEESTTT
jgi:hypothetical protein